MIGKQFWIGVVSRAHVQIGVKGGFVQLNHGKKAPLQRLHAGDGLVFYSPKTAYPDGEACQMFTAIGIVKTGEIYQVDLGDSFKPFRVDMRFLKAEETAIKPLLNDLSFIKDKSHWSGVFRFGHLKVPPHDFKVIAEAMGRNFERGFGA
jgi:predicted RNA-binding protein